ncbi:NADPH:quinone reductase-like Zn-dependent oxidoreductase [Arthrobacter pascens]|uniref:zinc-binding dehydrogenase n=1 Tax=Arthrobacter pascens TaxID=1677 RepID=UPI002865819D|nr:zinc-binding dehydrogenase [Arthrobacter pascens]MDR6557538.1 NADPH:quinone reductase-like Zn-dependent oxidoreductase [Arthrobacter pascens]
MRAVYATSLAPDDPLAGLEIGDVPDTEAPAKGWEKITLKASALNHHDLFSLKGVLDKEDLPMVLGCDGAGVDAAGNEVIIHPVVASPGWRGDETLDPERTVLSERYPGTMADHVWVPVGSTVPKPVELSWEEAACLPTSWLTAYKMLFSISPAAPGSTILIQGAGGGVSTALISLASASGFRVWVTSRSQEKRFHALTLGAEQAFDSGARLPNRVDAVFDSVGQATWAHSLKALRPGGAVITCGATSGSTAATDLNRLFFTQLKILGSTMGTRDELERLTRFLVGTGIRPTIDTVLPLGEAIKGFTKMLEGNLIGKIVFIH